MDLTNIRELKSAARDVLHSASCDPKKLVLLHAGASALVLLAVTVLNYPIQAMIETTGGLSGLQLRSILTTVSSVLQMAANIALPFWSIGYTAAVLGMTRRQRVDYGTLLAGFRSFGPTLRLLLIRYGLYIVIAMLVFQPAMGLFMLTPSAQALTELLMPLMDETADTAALLADPAVLAASESAMLPMAGIFLALYLLVLVPVSYRLRFAELSLMDDPQSGALRAIVKSVKLTRRRCLQLFRLDLSYWWYHGLSVLVGVTAYGAVFLPLLGISLPVSTEVADFIFYAAYLAAYTALAYFAQNQVQTTFAVCYDGLLDAPPPEQKVPWNY